MCVYVRVNVYQYTLGVPCSYVELLELLARLGQSDSPADVEAAVLRTLAGSLCAAAPPAVSRRLLQLLSGAGAL